MSIYLFIFTLLSYASLCALISTFLFLRLCNTMISVSTSLALFPLRNYNLLFIVHWKPIFPSFLCSPLLLH
ncbi:hypothetical protein J3Q64DRAFT_1739538 [Phycomyces blakesleeanus]|uniref:Secreted peptide n=1 Tax=Phycomyces blakesleeanus TaxID=4837 RepID=A0ABR3B1W3_PHYBL